MTFSRRGLWLFLLFQACNRAEPSIEEWPELWVDATCDFDRRCNPAEWHFEFLSQKECTDTRLADWANVASEFEDCTFVPEKAAQCVDWLYGSCKSTGRELDELEIACADVWKC